MLVNMAMSQLQQQMQQLQNQLTQAMEEQKYNVCASNKVKLIISDKEFMTNSKTLSNEQHGNTLFIQSLSQISKLSEGTHDGKDKEKDNDNIVELHFDRNPDLFEFILDYLRRYDLKTKLRGLKMYELEKLREDAIYFKIKGFQKLITAILYAKFNPDLGSPLIEISQNATVAKRSSMNADQWKSTAIYGTLFGTTSRYVEINIVTSINNYIMLGVSEAETFRVAKYPGSTNYPGCCYYCNNGYLYRSASTESWGVSSSCGDKIGALVKLNQESNMATIAFYKNGKLLNKETNLKNYMNVDKGVVFVVSLYSANEYVQLVQHAIPPQQ